MGSEDEGELRGRGRAQRAGGAWTRRLPNGQRIPTSLAHVVSRDFRRAFDQLPPEVQERAKEKHRLLERDPGAPELNLRNPFDIVWRVEIGEGYRAVGAMYEEPVIVWLWIGPHDNYEALLDDLREHLT